MARKKTKYFSTEEMQERRTVLREYIQNTPAESEDKKRIRYLLLDIVGPIIYENMLNNAIFKNVGHGEGWKLCLKNGFFISYIQSRFPRVAGWIHSEAVPDYDHAFACKLVKPQWKYKKKF